MLKSKTILANLVVLFAVVSFLSSCAVKIPTTVSINETALHPEGIDYNPKNKKFVIGSFRMSEVGYVDPATGAYETFIKDKNLAAVTGVYVDAKRKRLLVVSGNAGNPINKSTEAFVAYLGVYNLTTGARLKGVNLNELLPKGAPAFANDIAVDDQGDIYVTDSFSPVIYKVDGKSYEASIFSQQDKFAVPAGSFGLNGIVYTKGYLIVSKTDSGELIKVPLSEPNTSTIINAPKYIWADGLEFDKDDNLVVVVNGNGESPGAKTLSTKDNWNSATQISSYPTDAIASTTTAALASDGNVYTITSYFGKYFNPDYQLDHKQFEILKIE